jgi:hypothetical protein
MSKLSQTEEELKNISLLQVLQEDMWDASAVGAKIQNLSDGYHTYNELYAYRKAYNALLFNEWAKIVEKDPDGSVWPRSKYDVHKSKCHSDGEPCFGGDYFVVIAMLPTGQISNHYKMKYWDDFKIPEEPKAKYEYDGHTSEEALDRMERLIQSS